MNKVTLIGNVTRDPETRTTSSGIAVCSFTLAVNRRFTNQQGVREADYINIVAWRQTGELCGKYLSKGSKAAIIGSMQTRSYDAQDGSKRTVTEVIAEEVEFLTSSREHAHSADTGYTKQPPQPPRQEQMTYPIDDDELPF